MPFRFNSGQCEYPTLTKKANHLAFMSKPQRRMAQRPREETFPKHANISN
jgi:hypothetical protein